MQVAVCDSAFLQNQILNMAYLHKKWIEIKNKLLL